MLTLVAGVVVRLKFPTTGRDDRELEGRGCFDGREACHPPGAPPGRCRES
jgi:hypothetical protein